MFSEFPAKRAAESNSIRVGIIGVGEFGWCLITQVSIFFVPFNDVVVRIRHTFFSSFSSSPGHPKWLNSYAKSFNLAFLEGEPQCKR